MQFIEWRDDDKVVLRKKLNFILILVITSILLVGWIGIKPYFEVGNYDIENTIKEGLQYQLGKENDLETSLYSFANQQYQNLKDFIILNIDSTEEGAMVQFKFVYNDNTFEGIAYGYTKADGWYIQDFDASKINHLIEPLTVRTLIGQMNGGDLKRNYVIISGPIKNNDIKEIRLTFFDNHINILKVDEEQDTFFTVRRGINTGVKFLEALDKNGEIIYQWGDPL